MNKLLARLAALVLTIGTVGPAAAQLLPPLPGNSLIVTLTSPSQGANVSGTIPVSASVSIVGSLTVSRVEFFENGNFIGSDSGSPYSISWDTRNVGNGSHTLSAVAIDLLGVRFNSNSVTVNVSNGPPPDTTAPNVSITFPANGATVSGTINVTASASDNVGVTSVQFRLDGVNAGAPDTSAPYSIAWNTTGSSNGTHTISAVARDAAGNTRTSTAVSVTVANDKTSPTVTINRAATQADPTSASPINFTVVFSESVSGFTGSDVSIGGTAGGTKTRTVTGGPSTYNVAVSGMTSGGTVIASIGAGVAQDAAGSTNTASTSTDNSVTFSTTPSAPTFASFTPAGGPVGTVVTITGANFTGATAVTFNTVSAAFLVDSATSLRAQVPAGATTGPIRVTTPGGTTTSSASFTVDAATPGVTRSEVSAASVTGTGWVLRGSEIAAFSGGSAGSSGASGDTARFTFSGTAVSWIGLKCNICGIATVSIDGGAPIPVDTAGAAAVGSPGLASEVMFTSPTLEAGSHILVITVTGNTTSGDAHVVVDAFDVIGGTGSNVTRVEQDNAAVSYQGTWIRDKQNSIASGGTFSEANVAGAAVTLSFTGTEVRWLGYRFAGGGSARVSLDGILAGELDTYSASPVLGVVFAAAGLSPGAHILTIEVTGIRDPAAFDSWVIIDAFDVTP